MSDSRNRLFLFLSLGVGLTGCSSDSGVKEGHKEASNLNQVGMAYSLAVEKLQRGPGSPEELTPHLKPYGDPAQLLRSPQDGQPYVIVWGVNTAKLQADGAKAVIIAYEKTGAGGKRYVLTSNYEIQQLPDDEFYKANFAAGHRPAGKK